MARKAVLKCSNVVIELALPGIGAYLEQTLSKEVLSEDGERLRRHYVGLVNEGRVCLHGGNEQHNQEIQKSSSQHLKQSTIQGSCTEFPENGTAEYFQKQPCYDDKHNKTVTEKFGDYRLLHRKDTETAVEDEVFTRLSHSDLETDIFAPRNLVSAESSSHESILTDNSEYEVSTNWENESLANQEEGYCTGDNAFSDNGVEHYSFVPNELGEIHSGTLYIREPTVWHKRWFKLNEQCLKCYRHRTEDKMLFEIPLKRAKLVACDKRRRKVFPFSLSVPAVKEEITFATTEGRSRQQWICVLSFVISKLEKHIPANRSDIEEERKISLCSLFQGSNLSTLDSNVNNCAHERTNVAETFLKHENKKSKERNTMSLSEMNFERGDTCSSRKAENEVVRPVEHWTSVGLQVEEEEGSELDTSIRPELADDEAFKELQQCLPDILQRAKKFTSSHKKHPVNKFQSSSEMHLKEETGIDDRARIENEPSPDANNMDDFAKAFSTPDLRWQSKVKRHGSLTTALSNKASRVKSKLTTSFFKKGKKIDTRNQKDLMSKITTFSGYLLRKKGSVWKSRWCVVKEHSFFCYKDFDTGVSELEFQLEGCNVNCVQESVAERPFTFSIRFRDEVVVLAAENDAEFEEWIMVLRTECSANNSSSIADDNSSKVMSSSTASPCQGGVQFHNPNTDDCKETTRTVCADRGYPSLPSQNLTVKQKLSTVSSRGKKAIFSSLTNRLGHKSKAKPVNLPNNTESKQQQKNTQRIEDGFVIVPCAVTADQQISPGARTDEDYSKEGYLFQRLDNNAWCRCWVKLENQYLHIFDDKECKAAVAVKIRLINCIVLDCESDVKPWILEVRRKFGQSLFLHADNKTEYDEWKKAISKSIVSSPFPPRQSSADQSVFHPEEIRSPDGCDGRTEEVFHNGGKEYDDSQGIRSSAPSLPLNQSPRPSTAGDISSAESEEGSYMCPKVLKGTAEGSQPQTESADVNKKIESPRKNRKVRRAVTNAFSSKKAGEYTARKRRSRTVAGVNVSLSLLTDVKHSSCLYIKNASGLWAKRWCVLQNDNLHFYKNAEDQNPSLSLNIKQPCEVRRVMKRSRRFTFDLALPQEHAEYCFAADNEAEMYRWMEILKNSLCDSRKELESEVVPWQNRVFDLIRTSEISRKPAINKDFQDVFDNSLTDTHLRALSLHDLRLDNFNRKNSVGEEKLNRSSGDVSTSVYRSKITSLEEVLKLLQDQRLLQQIEQTKQDKSKRVKLQWKRSAVVALDRSRSSPPQQQQKPNTFAGTLNRTDEKLGSPAAKRKESVIKTDEMDGNSKKRATSMLSLSSSGTEPLDELLSCGDIMEKVEKLAEEEKLQLLKNETLLRKRRNSLSLEKGVLERNRSKNLEKKSAVRKLLAKENSSKVTTTHVSEARLQEVTHQLMKIERSLEENKKQSADVNTKIMKSKLTRQKSTDKSSLISRLPGSAEERRAAFKNSSNSSERSFSSQGSFDEKFGKDSSDVTRTSLTKKVSLSSSISSSTSLATLEEELRKITPKVPRRFTETRRKKISLSSDCSPDTRESPPISRRAYSDLSKRTASASSESSSPGRNSPGFSGLEFSSSFDESSSLWTELDGQRKFSDSSQIAFGKRVRDDCPDTVNVLQSKNITVKETQNTQQEHQATFINALSKIKDFEEFTASVSKLNRDQI